VVVAPEVTLTAKPAGQVCVRVRVGGPPTHHSITLQPALGLSHRNVQARRLGRRGRGDEEARMARRWAPRPYPRGVGAGAVRTTCAPSRGAPARWGLARRAWAAEVSVMGATCPPHTPGSETTASVQARPKPRVSRMGLYKCLPPPPHAM
jgi:hypothetical protein